MIDNITWYKQAAEANETELSKAAAILLRELREETGIDLTEEDELILEQVLRAQINPVLHPAASPREEYCRANVRDLLENWVTYTPKSRYNLLTKHAEESEEESAESLQEILRLATADDPKEWNLAVLAEWLLTNLGSWCNLEVM